MYETAVKTELALTSSVVTCHYYKLINGFFVI